MLFVTIKPRFIEKELTPEVIQKIETSIQEADDLEFRPIYCPYCGRHIVDLFDDMIGHIAVKCWKCKGKIPINAAYFNRSEYIARIRRAKLRGEFLED